MEIQGPFTISINDNSETGLRELHFGFKPGFQQLELAERLTTLKDYVTSLNTDIAAEKDPNNQQGMILIAQVVEELSPHIESNEIPLEETIIIEIGPSQSSPFDELLRGATLK